MKKALLLISATLLLISCGNSECICSTSSTNDEDTKIPTTYNPWLCICDEFDYHSTRYRLSYKHDFIEYPTDLVLRLYIYDPNKISNEEFQKIKDSDLVIYNGTYCALSPTPYLVPIYTEKDNFDILYVGFGTTAIFTPITETN